jgi:hypothetical protein
MYMTVTTVGQTAPEFWLVVLLFSVSLGRGVHLFHVC